LDSNLVAHAYRKCLGSENRMALSSSPMSIWLLLIVVFFWNFTKLWMCIPLIMASILQFFSKVGWPTIMATKWIRLNMFMIVCNCKWKRPLGLLLGLKVIIVAW
jgi:hypothetical protein